LTAGKQLAGRVTADAASPERWTVRGKPEPKVNGRDIVLGRHLFTPDVTRPDVLFGQVIRPPAYGAKPQKVDEAEARIFPGLSVIHDGDFIGVVGPNEGIVRRGAATLKIDWTAAPEQPTSETVYAYFRKTAAPTTPATSATPAAPAAA